MTCIVFRLRETVGTDFMKSIWSINVCRTTEEFVYIGLSIDWYKNWSIVREWSNGIVYVNGTSFHNFINDRPNVTTVEKKCVTMAKVKITLNALIYN